MDTGSLEVVFRLFQNMSKNVTEYWMLVNSIGDLVIDRQTSNYKKNTLALFYS